MSEENETLDHDEREFDSGDVFNLGGVDYEVTAVSYQEDEGVKVSFSYTFRNKAELDDEREAAIIAQEAAAQEQAEMAARAASEVE